MEEDKNNQNLRILPDQGTTPHRRRKFCPALVKMLTNQDDISCQIIEMLRAFQANVAAQMAALEAQTQVSMEASQVRDWRPAPKIEKPATFLGVKSEDKSDLTTFLGQCEKLVSR